MLTCQFCGINSSVESGDFQLDKFNRGFWCEDCDGYTYLSKDNLKHCFTLIMEDKNIKEIIDNDSHIKFSKRISPYRYPGGKSKIIPYLYSHLLKAKSKNLYHHLLLEVVLNKQCSILVL